jgi:hypothetical protein
VILAKEKKCIGVSAFSVVATVTCMVGPSGLPLSHIFLGLCELTVAGDVNVDVDALMKDSVFFLRVEGSGCV